MFVVLYGVVRHMVRKNRQERFLASAIFTDDPKGEGMDSPSNPSGYKSPTSFWRGFFIVRLYCSPLLFVIRFEKVVRNDVIRYIFVAHLSGHHIKRDVQN